MVRKREIAMKKGQKILARLDEMNIRQYCPLETLSQRMCPWRDLRK